ncbi:hypothetical protein EDE04_3446 [Streptomyces sp. 2132.2]|uniref:hypothetical protein n=1 Tax=Streptomyces TaxID=1883 RepID=UPI000F4AEBEF|nr:hypothetical protein [Streptomyces sp. 2132.2]ROQ96974.1 hypothetical protein EDE04_3446 [Streptomyces sp. 2132.2]
MSKLWLRLALSAQAALVIAGLVGAGTGSLSVALPADSQWGSPAPEDSQWGSAVLRDSQWGA